MTLSQNNVSKRSDTSTSELLVHGASIQRTSSSFHWKETKNDNVALKNNTHSLTHTTSGITPSLICSRTTRGLTYREWLYPAADKICPLSIPRIPSEDRTVCNIKIIRRFNIIFPFVHPAAQASTFCISTNNV